MSRILDVYLQEHLVGRLEQTDNSAMVFTYDTDYLSTAPYGISLSLPLQPETFTGQQVRAFFSGLLPEENVRERLARYLGLSEKNQFALLEAVGGDCAGALALYPHGDKPSKSSDDIEVLDNARLKEILDLIKLRPMLAGDDGYRLSLAGAQDKLAVGFRDGQVSLIKGGRPTTHILKPMIERVKDSTHNELFCMKLAKMVGINVPEVSLHFVGNTPYCLIERYDRHIGNNGEVRRIHQEDFCQALGVAPEIKYEREGGPDIATCQNVITKHAARPALDQIKLLNIILFNYLVGNADAHGKNFSLLYESNKPELAPAYDLLSTAVYPELSEKMAMKIGGKYRPKDVYLHHFHRLVTDTKAAQSAMNRQIKMMTEKLMDVAPALKTSLNADGVASDVFDEIITIIEDRSKHLRE
ncbi:type II toxin-antitoxin system HipA family toxin [Candidatus Ichthyocystis hellenicum]|uniref:type II toxin-antitoxin system HipA family toxin n=1 Tax=Candidatus Ichthyocystis hellenicum TaxID=1561003 RepID=UPI000B0EF768|nr:type II toxin-antitoxin system HipA family toxin [Candidatus Ichthyocystis hellenicum]